MANLRVSFGRHLRQIRRERDLSQEQFSELVGISVDFLSLIERGINAPSFETIEQIAGNLKISVKELFDISGAPNITPQTRRRKLGRRQSSTKNSKKR